MRRCLICLLVLQLLLLSIFPLHSMAWIPSTTCMADSYSVDVDDSEADTDDDPFASGYHTVACSTYRDTLRAYTLSGQRIYGKAKVSRTRTSYNIIIKNGRKVLKR